MSWFLLLFASIVASIILVACGHTAKSGNTCDGTKTGVIIDGVAYIVTYHAQFLGIPDPNPYYDASPTQPATMTTITDNQGNDVLQFQDKSGLWNVTMRWSGCVMQPSSPVKVGGT